MISICLESLDDSFKGGRLTLPLLVLILDLGEIYRDWLETLFSPDLLLFWFGYSSYLKERPVSAIGCTYEKMLSSRLALNNLISECLETTLS